MRTLAVLLGAAAIAPASSAAAPGPTLHLTHAQGLVVSGVNFRPSERVTVTLHSLGVRIQKTVAEQGRFRIVFAKTSPARCAALSIVAVGSLGSRASLAFPRALCLPTPAKNAP
jgi:hypothetical protein